MKLNPKEKILKVRKDRYIATALKVIKVKKTRVLIEIIEYDFFFSINLFNYIFIKKKHMSLSLHLHIIKYHIK